MRFTLGTAIAVVCLLAQPGHADGVSGLRGDAPTDFEVNTIIGTGSQAGMALSPNFRLRLDFALPVSIRLGGDHSVSSVRRRFASTMIDFYPIAGDGFHLSAGGRLGHSRKSDFTSDNALLYAPKGFADRKAGLKKFASAMTVGYSSSPQAGLNFGVEAGTLLERGDPASRELSRFARRGSYNDMRFKGAERFAPVVQASLSYKF